MKVLQPRLTYPELRLMPENGKRYELIDGEVFVTASPSEKHQRVLVKLFVSIYNHVDAGNLGRVYISPSTLSLAKRPPFSRICCLCPQGDLAS
jgi:Uma2 family endonuclease